METLSHNQITCQVNIYGEVGKMRKRIHRLYKYNNYYQGLADYRKGIVLESTLSTHKRQSLNLDWL